MEREEILERLTGVLREIMCDDNLEVTEESSLMDDIGVDSLEAMELLMDLESEFEITLPEKGAEELVTVKDVIDFIEENV